MYRVRERIAARLFGILTCLTSGIALAHDGGSTYYYSYFKEALPVTLDRSQVAVLETSAVARKSGVPLAASLSAIGIAPEDLEQMAIGGWVRALTPAVVQTDMDVENLVATLAETSDAAFVSPVFRDARGDPLLITSDLLIGFADTVSAREAEALLADLIRGEIEDRNYANMPGVYRMKVDSRNGFEVLELANSLATLPEVRFAESDMIMTARRMLTPNDPYFSLLWGLHNTGQSGGTPDMDVDAPEAWDISTGDSSIKVVILDDGVEQDHPDINQLSGWDFTGQGTGGGPGNQCDNHGTAVAGCVSAIINNSTGVVGVAPDCKVMSARYTISNIGSPCPNSGIYQVSWLVSALDWAQTNGARVTNNSNSIGYSSSVNNKYQTTRAAGLVHFAASGNEGTQSLGYPASSQYVNAVGALDRNGERADFSNYENGLAFTAPGEEIRTTDRTGSDGYASGDYTWTQGTSFSSPYAAGVAALVLSVDDSLEAAQVEELMQETCVDRGGSGYDMYYGWGFVNAEGALAPIATGACCLPDGSCVESLIQEECFFELGEFRGFSVPCGDLDPPCEVVPTMISGALGSATAFPEGAVPFELLVEEVEDLKTYQTEIMITRTSGEGALEVYCPEGGQIDVTRPDFVFAGHSAIPGVACEWLQLGATSLSGAATVGSEPKYLGDFTLHVSADTTPGTTFEVAVVPEVGKNFLRDSMGLAIRTRWGPAATLTVLDPASIPKNRYVSFSPYNPENVAFRVEMTASTYFPDSTGVLGWVGEPFEAPEDPGVWLARIEDTMHIQDWSLYPMIHVGDCGIVPAAVYEISSTPDGIGFDDPIVVGTILEPAPKKWCDCVGELGGDGWSGPNGVVNMDDVMASVQKFQKLDSAPHLTWVDVDAEVPNAVLNMTDIFQIVKGFKGESYPFNDPADCP